MAVTVNGTTHRHEVEARLLLVYYLREVLTLTGTHIGCDTTSCGACTIIMDVQAVKSWTLLAAPVEGEDFLDRAGLGQHDALHPPPVGFWGAAGLPDGLCPP